MIITRQTKYIVAVLEYIKSAGHCSNCDILLHLQKDFPDLSATTVHRITSRLAMRGELALAPPTTQGATRFDGNLLPHDLFSA